MVKRVSQNWLAEGEHPTLDHVFEHIGVTWPINKRERILRIASFMAFPPNRRADVWREYDQSQFAVDNKFYYPIIANLMDSSSNWFNNLRLIQIRKKLNLISSMRVCLIEPSLLAGEVLAKTKALELVVGKEMIHRVSIPPMKKPRIQGHLSMVRAQALRNTGLEARDARN